ncbi:hypothetical protein D3C85_1270870 [compost metagenome]
MRQGVLQLLHGLHQLGCLLRASAPFTGLVQGTAGEFIQSHQLAIGEPCLVITVGRFERAQLGRAVLVWFLVVLLTPQLIAMPDCPPVGEHHQSYQPVDPPFPGARRVRGRYPPEGAQQLTGVMGWYGGMAEAVQLHGKGEVILAVNHKGGHGDDSLK